MWKYFLSGIILVWSLLPVAGSSDTYGVIKNIESMENSVVPTRIARVFVNNKELEAQYYETAIPYKVGDKVIIETQDGQATITDHFRTPALKVLFGIFLIVVIIVTDTGGLRSLAGLLASFAIIFKFVLPQIAAGAHPILVVVIASTLILVVGYYLTHGLSVKTTIALVGTFFALLATAILAMVFGYATRLTGYGSEEASFLPTQIAGGVNIYNILLAGIIIGALGVLDDITISQVSVVSEIKNANKKFGLLELYARGMRVGHDHIASLVNTLVLVYTGASLPLLLLFVGGQQSFVTLVNYEPVAEEIVRTMVGSIGLVIAVPITTLIAAYWYGQQKA